MGKTGYGPGVPEEKVQGSWGHLAKPVHTPIRLLAESEKTVSGN